ncbi:undecaprenyldiphospho-muramoylpentapeptide beta-N-acetylglucosaminyltransferase [Zhihengliuella flava]|uniref:UDP-N-acetylglucosamine--N-acetylmuramyl-(pentapeptide) pyrophosphoryl-undecaprenol N-acetylglucosamine transferase n=1 Tax=Zhihengliuella flava TaxID=1285193 RepID=A0A931DBP4_9MICC|nr:undecaprenyldiphospho-muramoylpentapeptide beta-N-acetylglucosaminyltransferase [Zhihengliuella flava]MBG6085633.1 UDP-N-acetylglucosamine--N-acetylmuramyl-(pentapeptide) pyrophosphoryl-undecaprenol N-acetylglucosamine transferase [Zhihengliuella flava]
MNALSVVLAGGGTAGHISPLLAIARALEAADPATRITAVGTASGMETRLVPEAGYRLETIERVPMPRRPSPALLKLPARFAKAVRRAGAILDDAEADVVVGVGGYVCTPVYVAAKRRKIPVVIHEANARAGLANKVGARFAARVATAFAGTSLPGAHVIGMPMRAEVAQLDRRAAQHEARISLGLDPQKRTLVVTGGSSGAVSMNHAVAGAVESIAAAADRLQVLHVTGRDKRVLDAEGALLSAPGYVQVEYVDGMERAYAAADLMACRSGAGTVCELAAVGLPSVLVPLPIGNGEQRHNGAPLVAAGGAVMVDNDQFTADYVRTEVLPLVADADRLDHMGRAAAQHGRRDAAEVMAQLVFEAAAGA